jgi:hypothetical protein
MVKLFNQSRYVSKKVKNIISFALARDLLKNANPNGDLYQKYTYATCTCQGSEKTNEENATINGQDNSQLTRQVETILYVPGGRTQFGNFLTNDALMAYLEEIRTNPNAFSNGRVNFNGQFEGQPGGIRGPPRNRF